MRPELIAIVVACIALPAVAVVSVIVHRWQVAARTEAAERLGLAYARGRDGAERGRVLGAIRVHGSDRLAGTWRGRQARLDFARQSHGGHGATHYTRAVLERGAPPGIALTVERETVKFKLGEALGLAKDLKTGDAAVDRAWRLRGSPEAAAVALLRNPAVRAGLERIPGTTALLAHDGRLELLVRKVLKDPEQMRAVLDTASDLADAVSAR